MNLNREPRVLVIAHNAFSQTNNNGKTLSSFFSGWRSENLAQLYITDEEPDRSVCKRFFRITDREILCAAVRHGTAPGKVLPPEGTQSAMPRTDASVHHGFFGRLVARRPSWMLVGRDLCWGSGAWKTPALEAWIDEFSPEVVFMQCSAPAIYDIAFWVCDHCNIPLFLEITDDYTSSKFSLDPFFWIYLRRMRRQMRRAIDRAEKTLVIGRKMEKEYAKRFGGAYAIAMNAVEIGSYVPPASHDPIQIVYTGNLGLGRWKTIQALGNACQADPELKEHLQLHVYSGTQLSSREYDRLARSGVCFHGKVSAQVVAEVQTAADILLHVESFDAENRYVTRYSVSTKISEYLSRGRCLLAVGPADVASIEYIRDERIGVVLSERKEAAIRSCLLELVQNRELRLECGRRAYEQACSAHDIRSVQREISQMLATATGRAHVQEGE